MPNVTQLKYTLNRYRQEIAICSMSLILAATVAYVKYTQLAINSGLLSISRFIGRSTQHDFSLLELLAFYRQDFVVALLLVPLALIAVTRVLPSRFRIPFALFSFVLATIVLFVGLRSIAGVGHFLSHELAHDAMAWAVDHPEDVGSYVTVGASLKLGVILAAYAAVTWLILGTGWPRGRTAILGAAGGTYAAVLLGTGLVLAATLHTHVPQVSQRESVFEQMARAYISTNDVMPRVGATHGELFHSGLGFMYLPQASPPRAAALTPSRWDGAEKNSDLVVIVLETAPQRVWPVERMPGLTSLLPRAFVSRQHFTTYPYTSDAMFSVVSGFYPLGRRKLLDSLENGEQVQTGLATGLARAGYDSTVYSPYRDALTIDTRMYRAFGFRERFESPKADAPLRKRAEADADALLATVPRTATSAGNPRLRERLVADEIAFNRMLDDIVARKRAGRHFVSLFMPQIGHGPWFDVVGDPSVKRRGAALVEWQDRWIARLVERLAQDGWLDSTVIVVTGDHGIRTRSEDPALPFATLTNYTARVPLYIFAPNTLSATHVVDLPTSHIDITPTLHALLGVHDAEESFQGVPLWDRDSQRRRRLFVFAAEYLGADAYVTTGLQVVRQSFTGLVFEGKGGADDLDSVTPVSDRHFADTLGEPIRGLTAVQPLIVKGLPWLREAPRAQPSDAGTGLASR